MFSAGFGPFLSFNLERPGIKRALFLYEIQFNIVFLFPSTQHILRGKVNRKQGNLILRHERRW